MAMVWERRQMHLPHGLPIAHRFSANMHRTSVVSSVPETGFWPLSVLTAMASAPETLTLEQHRDLRGKRWPRWVRRSLLLVVGLIVLAALLNLFGQRPTTSTAAAPAAQLQVYAPVRVRSGLVYAARFRIDAHRSIKNALLVLDPGWAEQYTVNGLAPQPLTEGSRNGKLEFGFGHIPTAAHLTFWLSLQVNPTNVGHRTQNVRLYDGGHQLAEVKRTITIFP